MSAADDPRALNSAGVQALAAGQLAAALDLLERATRADPGAAELWLNLATAQRRLGDAPGELASLDRALAIDPYMVIALLAKAQALERQGDLRQAAPAYGAILNIVGNATLPPALAAALAHGRTVIAADSAALAAVLGTRLAPVRAQVADADARRFDQCVDALLGRRRIYRSQPTGLAYPGLPDIEFFPRAALPWLAEAEAATPVVQRELAGVLGATDAAFAPYVDFAPGMPVNQWAGLNRSLDWSAFFLWQDGVRNDANCARCPQTAALLERLPLLDIPGRGPTAFFSILRPGARIPPHTGVSNTRTIVHLPLVVPPGCGFRVGGETRDWVVGTAFAFDDTIEHEAWNTSDQPRAVLIFDTWNPGLSPAEHGLLRALTAGLDAHGGTA